MHALSLRRLVGITGLVLSLVLSACGGGGGGASTSSTPSSLSGTVATGAPMGGATITVFDKTGATVGTTTVADDGTYSVSIASTAQPPFVLVATREDQVLYSSYADGQGSTLNITPLSSLLAARLSTSGDPSKLATEISTGASTVTLANIQAVVTELTTALGPVISAAGGNTATSFLTGSFSADGTSLDRALDVLNVDTQNIDGTVTMVVTINTTSATDSTTTAPISLSFNASTTALPTVTASISSADLISSGGSTLIPSFLNRMSACYALDVSVRVVSNTLAAPECKTLFFNDDFTTYKHNSFEAGDDGATGGLDSNTTKGMVFDRGNFEYFRGNAESDWVISFRKSNPDTNEVSYVAAVVRKVTGTSGDKLVLIGNQKIYNATVKAYVQYRDYVNDPTYSHYATGYDISIANHKDGSNNPLFSQVVVTTPRGSTLTYKPKAGLSFLGLVKNGNTLSTSIIRLNAKYVDPTRTTGHPATDLEGLPYATFGSDTGGRLTDAEIAAIPDQGVWKFDFYLASNPSVIGSTSYFKTITRARTLAEIGQMKFANLTSDFRTELATNTAATSGVVFGTPTASLISMSDQCDGEVICLGSASSPAWTVPDGAVAPTGVNAYGSMPSVTNPLSWTWDDPKYVKSNARSALVYCNGNDGHCDNTYPQQYKGGTTLRGFQLAGYNSRLVQIGRMFILYKKSDLPVTP
jgi:hypothetical protein